MRVLLINSVCGRQSTGRIVSDLQLELKKEGHECIIAYGEKNSLDTEGNFRIGSEIERYYHAVMSRLFDCHGLCSKLATKKLVEFIRGYSPDLIHLHNIHGYYLHYEILFSFLKSFGKPILWTFHDCWPFTGHCTHFDLIRCNKWKTQCVNCPQKHEYPKSILCDSSASNFKKKKRLFTSIDNLTVVTPSAWLKTKVRESFFQNVNIRVIPNGIDTDLFKPMKSCLRDKFDLGNQKIILGVSSVWHERKGFYDYIKLSRMLSNDFRIVLIGVNKQNLKELADTSIVGVCRTDSKQELAAWYSLAYCFLNLTYEDNFPTVNIESLACGTPVITYETGGCSEALTEKCGVSIPQGDLQRVYAAIQKCSFLEQDCVSQGLRFKSETSYSQYVNLFESLYAAGK